MTEDTAPDPQTRPSPTYALEGQPKRFRRVKLAVFLCSLTACITVAIIGFLVLTISVALTGFGGMGGGPTTGAGAIGSGALLAAQLSALNFILFFITIPAAAIAMALSIARFPYQGIFALSSYLRWGAIWGAVLVGATTGFFGLFDSPASGLGALLSGGLIGGLAGTVCGYLFHTIVKPGRQLTEMDVSVF